MRIKVLQISARADMGGGPRHIENLLNVISNEIECYVGCPDEEPFHTIFEKIVGNGKLYKILHRKVELKGLMRLHNCIKEKEINIIHCHGKGASVYGRLLRIMNPNIKLVYTLHGIHTGQYSKLKEMLYIKIEQLSSFLYSDIIYVSESEKTKAKNLNLYKNTRFKVIPNGVPPFIAPDKEAAVHLKSKLFKEPKNKIIITFSSFNYMKNMNEALKIAETLKNFNFLWLGTGEDIVEIEAQIKSRGIKNVCLAGVHTNVNDYLGISDAYLSTSRWEGMPLSILEAMAAGIPTVASNVTGNKDLINSITGQLYQSGEVQEAAYKLKNVLETLSFNKESIINHFNENYSSFKMGSAIMSVYINTVNN